MHDLFAPACKIPDASTAYRHWKQQSDRENFHQNLAFLKQNTLPVRLTRSPDSVTAQWLFCHVPKTGGTTLENILAKNTPLTGVLRINAPVLNNCPCCYTATGRHPRLIMGHHPLHGFIYQLLPAAPLFHFSLVRHPLARVVSWFNYLKTRTDHALYERIRHMNLDTFLRQDDLVEIRNGQCRRFAGYLHLSGSPDDATLYKEARHVLDTGFSFVGTTERFDESLLVLQKLLGLPDIFYRRLNPSRAVISAGTLTPAQRQRILAMNQADAALYDWVDQELSRLTKEYLDKGALSAFRENNRRWQNLLASPLAP